jgi:hypothetical protein
MKKRSVIIFSCFVWMNISALGQQGEIFRDGNPIDGYCLELNWDLSNLMLGTLFVMDHSFIPSKDYNGIGTGTQDIQVLIVNADGETTFEKTFQ